MSTEKESCFFLPNGTIPFPLGPEGPFLEMYLHGPLYADAKPDPQSQPERAKYKILPLLLLLWPHAAKSVTRP